MEKHQDKLRLATIILFCLLNIGFGLYAWQMPMLIGGAAGMVYAAVATAGVLHHSARPAEAPLTLSAPAIATEQPAAPNDTESLVRRMLTQSRHALLLRKQVVGNLHEDQFQETCEQLHAHMALVPEGDVVLGKTDKDAEDELGGLPSAMAERRMHVNPLFLDRYTVTNRQYYEFVDAGGYRDMTLWEPKLWAAVLDLVDQTGQPGPAFWQNGRYLPGTEDLPVVGVSWYEAQACARWMGKRLPTDAEWVKAACWPVATGEVAMVQRRFPWGDGLDRSRANLWGSGPNRIVAVTEFPTSASVGGIYQMVGNVWEWSANDFHLSPHQTYGGGDAPLKSIRGGAFDTYFDNQATCQFESGEYPLSRRHNIGFRCAIGTCDLVLDLPQGAPEDHANVELAECEAVHA
ncbi:MAG: formylglycine-generating enzyme family protein [Planctomycetota bacterium]